MTRITQMILATREDIAVVPTFDGTWHGYWIELGEDNHRPLITCNPVYESEDVAIAAGKALIEWAKEYKD